MSDGIIFAQFLYARHREFVVIFVLLSNLQTDQMSEWRGGGQELMAGPGACGALKHRKQPGLV